MLHYGHNVHQGAHFSAGLLPIRRQSSAAAPVRDSNFSCPLSPVATLQPESRESSKQSFTYFLKFGIKAKPAFFKEKKQKNVYLNGQPLREFMV